MSQSGRPNGSPKNAENLSTESSERKEDIAPPQKKSLEEYTNDYHRIMQIPDLNRRNFALSELLTTLTELEEETKTDSKANIANFRGTICARLGDFNSAIEIFMLALTYPELEKAPLLHLTLITHYAKCLNSQNRYTVSLPILCNDTVPLAEIVLGNVNAREGVSLYYLTLAETYRKINLVEHHLAASIAFNEAVQLWPDHAGTALHAARGLSKISEVDALLAAEELLKKFSAYAKDKALFQYPYYRADVNIKLAAFHRSDEEKVSEFMTVANECLETAERSIKQKKDSARLANLKCNLAIVENKLPDAKVYQQEAKKLRAESKEPLAKSWKFFKKLVDLNQAFNPYMLFSNPTVTAPSTEYKSAPQQPRR